MTTSQTAAATGLQSKQPPATASTAPDRFDLEYRLTELRGAQLVAGMIFAELISEQTEHHLIPVIRERCQSTADKRVIVMEKGQLDALVHAFYALEDAVRKACETFYASTEGEAL